MPIYTSEQLAHDRDLAVFSYRKLEKESGVTASRLCLHEKGRVILREEQLDRVQRV
jgi:hypothetical protein